MTIRAGLTRSISERMSFVVAPSSRSAGLNIVYWLSGSRSTSDGTSSMISMPASDQPWDAATDSSSSLVSESVT